MLKTHRSTFLALLLCTSLVDAGSLKGVRNVPGAFEIKGAELETLKAIPLERVPEAYGKQFVLLDGKLEVCSWDYASHHGLIRRLRPIGADLSGAKLSRQEVEPDFVAIDTRNGLVKFFANEDDTEIKVVGRARTLHGAPTSICANGDFAFLSNGEGGHNFQVIDGRDPDHPHACAAVACGNYARGVHYHNGLVFYAVSYTGVWILDVSDPLRPRKIGLWEPPGERLYSARHGFGYGNILYAAGSGKPPEGTPEGEKHKYDGTFILDISDPSQPREIGKLEGAGYWIQGDGMYRNRVETRDGEKQALLDIYSLEDPKSPKLLWSYPWPGGRCRIQGDRLLGITSRKKGKEAEHFLYRALIKSPTENAVLSEVPLSVPPFNVTRLGPALFQDNTLFLISGQDLLVLDITDPREPKLLGQCWSGPTNAIALGNQKLFCAGGHTYQFGESGVWILDISDPSKPQRKGYVPTGGEGQNNWIGMNGKLCLAGGEWGGHNWVVDVSDRENPKFLGTYFDQYFNGNNSYNIAVGDTFYMDDRDGTKILDLRVWKPHLGKQDASYKPLTFDTYEYNPDVVKGLMQIRHKPLDRGARGIELYMERGSLTSKPFRLPKGDYILSLRYLGHRVGAHDAVRLMIIDGDKPTYDTGYLASKGRQFVDEEIALSIAEDLPEARAHITGCDVSLEQALLKPKAGGDSPIPNGDFEKAGPTTLQAPGWEIGGPRHTWHGPAAPNGLKYQGVLTFEDRIYYAYSGRRLYVFDATTDPAELLTPGGMLLPSERGLTNFFICGSLLYVVAAPEYLSIFDISDLNAPKLIGEHDRKQLGMKIGQFMPYPPSGWVGPHYGLWVSKGIMVCGERYHYKEGYLHVIDVRNPKKPKWLTRFEVGTKEDAKTECWGYRKLIQMGVVAPLGVFFDGGRWVYTAEYWSGAKIFDLSNPSKPKLFYNEIWPLRRQKNWEDRKTLIPEGFFYMPGYSVNAWCGGEVWGHHMICTRLSHCAVLKVPRVSQAPKKLDLRLVTAKP